MKALVVFTSLVVGLLLTPMLMPSHSYGKPTNCQQAKLAPIAEEFGQPERDALGAVCFATESVDAWPVWVQLSGLTPTEAYWLSLNVRAPASPENDLLGRLLVPGWPPGAYYDHPSGSKEGYWDFKEITTDSRGSYEAQLLLPLPAGTYRVKFFVKHNYSKGGQVVLHQDALGFTVKSAPPGWPGWVWGGFGVAGVLGCGLGFWVLARRWKARGAGLPHQVPGHVPPAPPVPPVDPGTTDPGVVPPAPSVPSPDPGTIAPRVPERFRYSLDYRSVSLDGQDFFLTDLQARVIQLLHNAYLQGTPALSQDTILNTLGSGGQRLRDIFRASPAAWQTLIRQERRGLYRLNL